METLIDVVVFKLRKIFADAKLVKSCVIYLPKNSTPSSTVATALIAPEICQSQPPIFGSHIFFKFHRNRFTFGERVKAVFWPIQYLQYSPTGE